MDNQIGTKPSGQDGMPAGAPQLASPSPMTSNTNKTWLWVALVVVVVILLAGAYWMFSNSTKTVTNRVVKIGLIGPFTGDAANYGEVMKHGAEMAQRDFNQAGLTLEIIERDTGCDATKAEAAAKELVQLGVVAIIGEVCSGATLGALPVANESKVLLISPSSSSPDLTVADDYFFRTYPTDTYQGVVTSKLMYDKGIKKIAIMHSSEAYGKGLADVTVDNFEKLGGTVVANVSFDKTATDFASQIAQIKAAKPDALYIVTNGIAAGAAIVVQADAAGLKVPLYAADALKDSSFVTDVGAAGNGLTLITVTPGNKSFIDEYRATYGSEPANATGAQSYDAFMALARVIADGAKTGDDIRTALPAVKFDGKSGKIEFDQYGDLKGGGYLIYTIQDKKFVRVEE